MLKIKILNINKATIELIKSFEGLELKAYPDPATKNDPIKKGHPWTIGWGTTIYPDGQKVKQGDSITQIQAEAFLLNDLSKFALGVGKLIIRTLTDNQFGAILSFAYNVGLGNLKASTLLKKVNINPKDLSIASEFAKWNKAAGKVMNGLTRRRTTESQLYFK